MISPEIRFQLQLHLTNTLHETQYPFELAPYENLRKWVEINPSLVLDKCMDANGKPISYPKLPKRNYLVACISTDKIVRVFSVYNLKQMQEMQNGKESGAYKELNWRILELSEQLEQELRDIIKRLAQKEGVLYSRL